MIDQQYLFHLPLFRLRNPWSQFRLADRSTMTGIEWRTSLNKPIYLAFILEPKRQGWRTLNYKTQQNLRNLACLLENHKQHRNGMLVLLLLIKGSNNRAAGLPSLSAHFTSLAPALGTTSPTLHLIEPCWGPAPCVPCYMHRQGNASSAWPGVQPVRLCPLEPRERWWQNNHPAWNCCKQIAQQCMGAMQVTRLFSWS